MNVLIVASWYPTPENPLNGIFFQQRARALARCGCTVSVASLDVRTKLGGRKSGITVERVEDVIEYRYFKRNITPFWEEGIAKQQISMLRKIYERVCNDSGKPDIIHLDSARCAYAAVALAKKENIPLTYTEHYSGILNSQSGTFLDKTMRLAVENADHTFLLCSAMKHRLKPQEEKCSFLPNSIDFSEFYIKEPSKLFTFCALASLRKIKGLDILLQAFAKVQDAYPECRLVIGGDGLEKQSLLTMSEELGLNEHVTFCGRINSEQRGDFFAGNSAFVCSSLTETFSIVVVEAFASGLPVVATKCGGPEDLVKESNGYLVEKGDVDSLAEGMIKMIQNRNLFDSEKIRKDAYFLYDESCVVEQQIRYFDKLCKQEFLDEK